MATRSVKSPRIKRSRIELDLERARIEANWIKTVELASQLQNDKNFTLGAKLTDLIIGESKIELCDKDSPPEEEMHAAEIHLNNALKITDEQYGLEATVLWGKLHYMRGKYKECVDTLESVNLNSIKLDLPTARSTLLVAEGFAMIGLSMENCRKGGSMSKKLTDVDLKILDYFEKAGDLCIYHLQELERAGISIYAGSEATANLGIPKSVETAIQRSPIIYIQNGDLNMAVSRFRQLLRYVETAATKGLRQTLARQLAEVLLRGVCSGTYQKWILESDKSSQSTTSIGKQPSRYPSDRFIPEDHMQEAVLMLLISEYIANQEAILNRSPELSDARIRTLQNTTAVYDLLAIALVRKGCYNYLCKTMEHSLKFSYQEFHIWYQFALSLISAQKYNRAYLVLQECQRIDSNHAEVYLLMGRLCLEHLHLPQEAVEAAQKAVDLTQPPLKARAYLVMGWGHSVMAKETRVAEKKKELQQAALKSYTKAVELDPDDHLSWYHLGLEQACLRHLDAAMSASHRCLTLHPGFAPALHLLSLLHTASGQTAQAAQVIQAAIYDHPNNINLLLTKAKIDAVVSGPDKALQTYRSIIEIWKDNYSPDYDANGFLEKLKVQPFQFSGHETLDRDSGSLRAESMAASRLENALSEIASSVSSSAPRVSLSQAAYLQMQILLSLGELYIELNKLREASECIDEASSISKLNYQVLYLRGRFHESRGNSVDARKMYESAVAINPSHVKTLQRLGNILHRFGEFQLAEKILRDALSYDATSSTTWQYLGEVLQSRSQNDAASQCLMVAADLEQTEPLEPFYFLPRGINCL